RVTARVPLGRTALPEELGGTVVYLAAPASDYVTGELIRVDGGVLAG
ncbi:MAG: SDR family oxidoreductase, partial [candidate division NC10 bacterium]|nr:SDR family oxidoreductase [candidate division NC10 bacterium]